MTRRDQGASPGNEAPQDFTTGFVGDVSAVSIDDCTPVEQPPASHTNVIVDTLIELSQLDLSLALAWARALQRRWPDFLGV